MLAEFNIDDGLPLSGPWHMLNLLSFSAFSKNSNSLRGSGSGSTLTLQIYMEFINLFPLVSSRQHLKRQNDTWFSCEFSVSGICGAILPRNNGHYRGLNCFSWLLRQNCIPGCMFACAGVVFGGVCVSVCAKKLQITGQKLI